MGEPNFRISSHLLKPPQASSPASADKPSNPPTFTLSPHLASQPKSKLENPEFAIQKCEEGSSESVPSHIFVSVVHKTKVIHNGRIVLDEEHSYNTFPKEQGERTPDKQKKFILN